MRLIRTLLCFICLLTLYPDSYCQFTQNGSVGLITVPSADVIGNREIMAGFHINPKGYKYYNLKSRSPENNELIYSVNIGFIPRVNLILGVLRDIDHEDTIRQGIGDRSLQISYLMFKERKFLPAMKINLTDPVYSVNAYHITNNIVMSKSIEISSNWNFQLTSGYGIDRIFSWVGGAGGLFDRKISQNQNSSDVRYKFLTGPFGGLALYYQQKIGVIADYDGRKINTGMKLRIWNDHFHLGTYLIGMKQLGWSLNYRGSLH